ncbi:MAG: BrnT family toxin [Brevundimonas sp.]|uniref:BrnT family toxin n=1 Tax=Brevundimonas sp. TaxID=1871086 RepID=UPI001A1D236F|nr:BrnT family toxin [Brevundimonas sp.]MBJ7318055.1 BrnT family toxin [Brevundimonas sp.]
MGAALEFEWDEAKAQSNLAKHAVPFAYAVHVFVDPDCVDIDASRTADGEDRRKAVGRIGAHLYAVVYTRRAGRIRLISARRCNRSEEKAYGDGSLHT